MKTFRIGLILLLFASCLQAQTVNKTDYWVKAQDTALTKTIINLPGNSSTKTCDSLVEIVLGKIQQKNDIQGNINQLIRLASKMASNNRIDEALEILEKGQKKVLLSKDTLNVAYSQLFFNQANFLRDKQKMAAGITPNLREISILKAINPEHPLLLDSYTNMMTNYFALRMTKEGSVYFDKIIPLSKKLNYPYYEINAYRTMGDIFKFYQPSLGLEYMQQANWLANNFQPGIFSGDPFFYISMGACYTANNLADSALVWFKKGIAVARKSHESSSPVMGYFYYYIGVNYKNLNDLYPAIAYVDSSLITAKQQAFFNKDYYYRTLLQKGRLLNITKQYEIALQTNKEVYANTGSKNAMYFSNAAQELSKTYLGLGEHMKALQIIQKNICFLTDCSDTSDLLSIPTLKHSISPQAGLMELETSLGFKAEILAELYEKENDAKYMSALIAHFNYLLTIIDLQAGISKSSDGLLELSARYRQFTERMIDFFAKQKPGQEILERIYPMVARSQAYSVLCQSYALRGHDGQKVLTDNSRRLVSLREELLSCNQYIDTIKYRQLKESELDLIKQHYLATLETGMEAKQIQIPQLQITDQTRTDAGIEENELLIDYYITPKNFARFTIARNHFKAQFDALPADFNTQTNSLKRAIKTGNQTGAKKSGTYLSSLLFHNLPEIKKYRKLTILPDQNLYYIPFELLYEAGSNEMLIEKYTISYRYTSHLFSSDYKHNTLGSLAAFAPMIGQLMPVLTSTLVSLQEIKESDYREILDANTLSFTDLPFSLKEVNDVAQMFQQKGYQTSVYKGSDATKENFRNSLADATIVHIATHGLVNRVEPEKSGLVFSADTSGRSDAMLYMGEMFGLKFNPGLVVLSACKSGTGTLQKGEGVMALPRGLLVAGAQNVMASLWKIHDANTHILMVAFYKHLLDGNDYSESLRMAKLDCIKEGFLPIDWAGFVLIEK
ncbi:MAG: CHAT domain-containing protein [Bacteroidales bacterium]|nr:CHAT domain-containing protein [Bacteroidales bacterium]